MVCILGVYTIVQLVAFFDYISEDFDSPEPPCRPKEVECLAALDSAVGERKHGHGVDLSIAFFRLACVISNRVHRKRCPIPPNPYPCSRAGLQLHRYIDYCTEGKLWTYTVTTMQCLSR
jgi:hypothetical protein